MLSSTAHGPTRSRSASVSSSIVSSASASAAPIPAMTASVSSGVNRIGAGNPGADDGSADRAPVHIGRSAVASRWTVPRGPNVFTSVRSTHSARCTSERVVRLRRPIESSAAWRIWAWTPHIARAISAGGTPVAGSASRLRAIRRAVTPRQVIVVGLWGCTHQVCPGAYSGSDSPALGIT